MAGPRYSRRELLLGVAAFAAARAASAQSTARYGVELVVFRQPGTPPPAPTIMTSPRATAPPGRVDLLPPGEWQLQNLAGGLKRSGGYRVLGHGAWAANVPQNGSLAASVEEVLPNSGLSGAVTIQRGQFLFVRVDVDYATPEGRVYQMRERRRVKFNERHYFDHPAIGAIAVVSPLGR